MTQSISARKTGLPIADIRFNLLGGGTWHSRQVGSSEFTLLTVYRGMWCGHCQHQLKALNQLTEAFSERGVALVAVSADTQARAQGTVSELDLNKISIGYDLAIEDARQLGLFISTQQKEVEMPLFSEPGTFLIKQDHTLFAAWIASNAFARIAPEDILDYIDFIKEKSDRPPRGSA